MHVLGAALQATGLRPGPDKTKLELLVKQVSMFDEYEMAGFKQKKLTS